MTSRSDAESPDAGTLAASQMQADAGMQAVAKAQAAAEAEAAMEAEAAAEAEARGMARRAAVFLLALSAAVLATVYAAEHLAGLTPCPLCLDQRWPWWLALCLGGAGLVRLRPLPRAALPALAAAVLLAGAGLAVYHVGVEDGHWAGPASCAAAGAAPQTLEALREHLLGTPPVRCDVPAWSLFGVSMAGYNALVSAGAALILFAVAGRLAPRRGRPKPG